MRETKNSLAIRNTFLGAFIFLLTVAVTLTALAGHGFITERQGQPEFHPIKKAHALYRQEQDTIEFKQSKGVIEDSFLKGDTVVVEGETEGDLLIVAREARVKGHIDGNLYAIAHNLVIEGDVEETVYSCAARTKITGNVGEDVASIGYLTLISGVVSQDLWATGWQVDLEGQVGDDTRVTGAFVTADGGNGGDFVATGLYNKTKNAVIDGDQYIRFGLMGEIGNIKDAISKIDSFWVDPTIIFNPTTLKAYTLQFLLWASTGIAGLLLIWMSPVKSVNTCLNISRSPQHYLTSWLIGMGTLLFTPLLEVLLVVGYVGIPIAIIIATAFAYIMVFWKVYISLALGKVITKIRNKRSKRLVKATAYTEYITGWIITGVLCAIPGIRLVFCVASLPAVIGAMAIMKFALVQNVLQRAK